MAVLLLAGLIVATTATYARHVSNTWRASSTSLWIHETEEAAESGLAFARQVLASGTDSYAGTISAGDKSVSVTLASGGGDVRDVRVDATVASLGTTVISEARVFAAPGAQLPQVTDSAATVAEADVSKQTLADGTVLVDQVLSGTVVIARGATVTLRDCVVKGTIVSEPALKGPPYKAKEVTTLTIEKGFRIDPGILLDDCAILLPDGTLSFAADSRIEVHGAVVANRLLIAGSGSMDGHLVSAGAFTVPAGIDQPGAGRSPRPWPTSLTSSSWGVDTLAFPSAAVATSEKTKIGTYAFPVK